MGAHSTALTTAPGVHAVTIHGESFSRDQLDLLKRTVAAGTSDDEFALFCEVARSTGLNPFQRQIYAIMRETWDPKTRAKAPKMTIQTGIDGYRLLAARTGAHAGTTDAVYGAEQEGRPSWASVTVFRIVGGVKAEFPATARWSEYAQTNNEGKPTGQWGKMPFLMLAKCAEALALRKAFPAELSGVYTSEEMSQADSEHSPAPLDLTDLTKDAKAAGLVNLKQLRGWLANWDDLPNLETKLTREHIELARERLQAAALEDTAADGPVLHGEVE